MQTLTSAFLLLHDETVTQPHDNLVLPQRKPIQWKTIHSSSSSSGGGGGGGGSRGDFMVVKNATKQESY